MRRSLHLLNYVDSPQFQRKSRVRSTVARHKLVRAVAYANGKLRVRTDQEQQLWSECSRLLANCIIYYNACILSELALAEFGPAPAILIIAAIPGAARECKVYS